MPEVRIAKGINLFYDERGSRNDPVIILIMGLLAQMTVWPDTFCDQLVANGFRVIRFDNRDCGLSHKCDDLGKGHTVRSSIARLLHLPVSSPYSLEDMANDVIQLMDALSIDCAHVCGASMGGMIAQICAIAHPHRVLSLTSLTSTTGSNQLPNPTVKMMLKMNGKRPKTKEELMQFMVGLHRMISCGRYYSDEELVSMIQERVDRSQYNDNGRQLCAVLAAKDRTLQLKQLDLPTLVIHGQCDPLVPLKHGLHTAESIPGSVLIIIQDMSHAFEPHHFPIIISNMVHIAQKASSSKTAA